MQVSPKGREQRNMMFNATDRLKIDFRDNQGIFMNFA